MIAFENERQTEEAVSLWREAFGDEEAYIRCFLSRHDGAAALTESENGALISALYLLDGAIQTGDEAHKAFYLFAAATFKKHRGQGYMARLLQKAKEYAFNNGAQYIALVPASPALFDYYARFGYQTAFYARTVRADAAAAFDQTTDRFLWSDVHLRYMKEEAKTFHYPIIEINGMLFSVDDDRIRIPDPQKEHPCGMLLPLTETAKTKLPDNAYIGLTME